MPKSKAPKKRETIEIRLPYEAKSAFMAQCRAEGRTASETLRGMIDAKVAAPVRTRVLGWRAVLAATVAGVAIGAVAGPTLASTSAATRPALHQPHGAAC